MTALVDVKAFTIFTLLFGVGFAMQTQRASAAGAGMSRYVRRLLVLLAIGLLHAYLFWWGDILRLYALLGLLLLPLARLRARSLAVLGIFVAVFATPLLRPMMTAWLPGTISSEAASAAALTAFQSPSWPLMLRANLTHDIWTRITAWGLPFMFLAGFWSAQPLARAACLGSRKIIGVFGSSAHELLPLGVALTAFVMSRDHGAFGPLDGWWRTEQARALTRISRSGASLALGLAYVAIFVLLFERPEWRRWLQLFAPVGRMALTNYLMQTVIALALFYGVGLGIGPRFGLVGVLASGVLIFLAQIAISKWWLMRFHFGPLEWLWRTLTYGHRQPMHRVRLAEQKSG